MNIKKEVRVVINKRRFGKRVANFRRRSNLSQAELTESLGVSAQAVSKWETAAALPDIEAMLALSKLYGVSVNELLEDSGLLNRIANQVFQEKGGIAYFVPPESNSAGLQWEQDMRVEGWITRNWRDAWCQPGGWTDSKYGKNVIGERSRPNDLRIGRRIAELGGVILDIGSGPGGGYMPFILQADPTAQIIISDRSHTVVEEWKRFLDAEIDSPYLYYAALDFCHIPFGNCTVDVVSDHGGIINCIGDQRAALRECYRILKPGDVLVSLNSFVTKEALASLPERAQQALLTKYPSIFNDLYEETVLAGFRKIDSEITDTWSTEEDNDSILAKFAQSLGIAVQFTEYVRFCEK